jgi:acetyl-CoA carboxylase biotin carboxyl carrier protein
LCHKFVTSHSFTGFAIENSFFGSQFQFSTQTLTKTIVDLKDIKAIIDLMKKNSITEFELEEKDSKLRLKRGLGAAAASPNDDSQAMMPVPAPVMQPMASAPAAVPAPAAAAGVPTGEIEIKSPMIGTFYRSPSPEAGPYADVGTEVNSELPVCIIEAMKVMNEIKAEVKGIITSVLVENGKPVEFGQPLFRVRPN